MALPSGVNGLSSVSSVATGLTADGSFSISALLEEEIVPPVGFAVCPVEAVPPVPDCESVVPVPPPVGVVTVDAGTDGLVGELEVLSLSFSVPHNRDC